MSVIFLVRVDLTSNKEEPKKAKRHFSRRNDGRRISTTCMPDLLVAVVVYCSSYFPVLSQTYRIFSVVVYRVVSS
jgi:hypothetical protein